MSPVHTFAFVSNIVLCCKISQSAFSLEFFRLESCINFSSSHSFYFPNPLNSSRFYSPNNIRAVVQIMESLIVQCSSRLLTSCGFSAIFPAAPCQSYTSSIHPFTKLIPPPWRYTTHSGCVFYGPLSGFSLLAYEVT